MSWLALLLIGVVLVALSWVPFPHPVPMALRVVGAVLVAFGAVFLIIDLVDASTVDSDVHVGAPQVALVT